MLIGERLRDLRQEKSLSQGQIEERSGLLRCYISRVENGHTVPSLETLEKLARALQIPLYSIFYDGAEPPKLPALPRPEKNTWETSARGGAYLSALRRSLARMEVGDRDLLLFMAKRMVDRRP